MMTEVLKSKIKKSEKIFFNFQNYLFLKESFKYNFLHYKNKSEKK